MALSITKGTVFGLMLAFVALSILAVLLAKPDGNQANADQMAKGSEILASLTPINASEVKRLPGAVQFRLEWYERTLEQRTGVRSRVDAVAVSDRGDAEAIYLAGLGESICVFFEKGAGTCNDSQSASTGQTYVADPVGCKGWRIMGIAPDNVERVSVVTRVGELENNAKFPVSSNIYTATVGNQDVTVRGLNSSGQKVFDLDIPIAEFASGNCFTP